MYKQTKQQEETQSYFRQNASKWKRNINMNFTIKQRNDYVLKVISGRKITENYIDIGCGTGDLACAVAKIGIRSYGIDFAEDMIHIAKANAKKEGCEAKFVKCSLFNFDFSKYDIISANGVIEYLSPKELDRFLDVCYKGLNMGGSLILSSRNRLFNIFSLNKFTKEEVDNGNANCLLNEAIGIVNAEDVNELLKYKTLPLSAKKKQVNTGIDVYIRYQYTPAQLAKELNKRGLKTAEIYPIHIHSVTPRFKEENPDIHEKISKMIQDAGTNRYLIPYASTFMIHAIKQ